MEECTPILLIKARTLEHKQPRKQARDKTDIVTARHLHTGHRGTFRKDNPQWSHVKSIKGRAREKPGERITLRGIYCVMALSKFHNFGEWEMYTFKDMGVVFDTHGGHYLAQIGQYMSQNTCTTQYLKLNMTTVLSTTSFSTVKKYMYKF